MVGLVVADYALLEQLTFLLYAVIEGKDADRAFVDFFRLQKSNLRQELTLKAAQQLDEPFRQAVKRVWKRFMAAAKRRAEVAHVSFLSDGKSVTRLRMFGTEPHFELVDVRIFDRTFAQYRTLARDVGMLATLIGEGRVVMSDLLEATPLGRLRQKQQAFLGSPSRPSDFGEEETVASLARLKILDFYIEKWKASGHLPQDFAPSQLREKWPGLNAPT